MIYTVNSLFNANFSFSQILAFVLGFILAVCIAFSVHEFFHAYTAYKLGDPTPKALGRVTLNPLKHLDAFGVFGFLFFGFGWAKPVPVNPLNFKKHRRDMFLVSISGVLSNLIMAFVFSGLFFLFHHLYIKGVYVDNYTFSNSLKYLIYFFLEYSVIINVALFVFNLIPIYPLDGFNALKSLVPLSSKFLNFMYRYGNILLIIFIITPFFDIIYGSVTGHILNLFFDFWGLFV